MLSDEQADAIQEEVAAIVAEAVQQADADPQLPLEDRFNDALAESYPLQK